MSQPDPLAENGYPFIRHYIPTDYEAFTQNWGSVQDSLGQLYFANGDGVLLYDGVNWEIVPLPDRGHAKSIAIDNKNTIYVGAAHEFGYLQADSIGKLTYVSLLPYVKEKDQDFTTIWKIHANKEGVYFVSFAKVFLWTGSRLKVWEIKGHEFHNSFLIDGKLYLQVSEKGLMQLGESKLEMFLDGAVYKNKWITVFLPYQDKNSFLVGTEEDLFLLRGKELSSFRTEAASFIKGNNLYTGILLNDSSYALGTLNGGLTIIDRFGEQQLVLKDEGVLASPTITALFQDNTGLLWVSQGYGISKIEYPAAYSEYSALGIHYRCGAIIRFKNKLYAGTNNGLFRLTQRAGNMPHFEPVQGVKDLVWDLLAFQDVLLVALENGVYQLNDEGLEFIAALDPSKFYRSKTDTNRVFVSSGRGLGSLYYQKGEWINEGLIKGINGATYTIIELPSGELWLETSENWLYKVTFPGLHGASGLSAAKCSRVGEKQGLPGDVGQIYTIDHEIYYVSDNTHECYVLENDRFVTDKTLNKRLGMPGVDINIYHVDQQENIWFKVFDEDYSRNFVAWNKGHGNYEVANLHTERISDLTGTSTFIDLKDSIAWYGCTTGLVRQDLKSNNLRPRKYHSIIKRVYFQSDSLLFAGMTNPAPPELPFTQNSFRFSFSSPFFIQEKANEYQVLLEGFDKNWSSWTGETQKDYTNLPEGSYIFKVRTKNSYDNISEEDHYRLIILPPWYRTWFAYLVYGLLSIATLWLLIWWRSRRLKKENLALEAIIKERTEEVRKKNMLLLDQTEKLRSLDQTKSRFFANISHEFRTPLTLMLGPLWELQKGRFNGNKQALYKMMQRNGQRLLGMVDQLLDLSKIESDKMRLRALNINLPTFIKSVTAAYESLAQDRGIDFVVEVDEDDIELYADPDKLEKILHNLLSNAFKFTQVEGAVSLLVSTSTFQGKKHACIVISDTGVGIAPDELPRIFDRFYQAESGHVQKYKGTGIGLALTKELVVIHHGEIEVSSAPGRGTSFTLWLPLGKQHLSPDEMEVSPAAGTKPPGNPDLVEADPGTGQSAAAEKAFAELSIAPDSPTPGFSASGPVPPRLLIIEDNADMRQFIGQVLSSHFQIAEACDGMEGLKKAAELQPDLVISDVMMPGMDGMALCRKLKFNEDTSHIPVILLTARSGKAPKIEGLETGADDYLTKPFDADELLALLKNRIEQRRILKDRFSKEIRVQPKDITVTSADERFLQKTMDIVEDNMGDFDFNVQAFIERMQLGRAQVERKLKGLTGQTPVEFIRSMRLKRAAQKIVQKENSVSQIAYSVGFSNLSYFARCFKEQFGESPSTYSG
ncbi:ATP-binding protein [Parapedobacter tibetensis]|uniref:ATP-binding protein n=1 Tax=Parapedobacter tibetensis TaxID=2972951 RepID=UPI00214D82BD|nr:ATP-binding protein [Parapedobacter tibetensis]